MRGHPPDPRDLAAALEWAARQLPPGARVRRVRAWTREYSNLARLVVEAGGVSQAYYLKWAGAGTGSVGRGILGNEIRTLELLRAAERDPGFDHPRLVAAEPGAAIVLMHEVPGRRLGTLLALAARAAPLALLRARSLDLVAAAGHTLGRFHALPAPVRLQDDWVSRLEDVCQRRAEALAQASPTLADLPVEVAVWFRAARGRPELDRLRPVHIHGDFAPQNLRVAGRRLCLLDFGFSKAGVALQDVHKFLLALELDYRATPWSRRLAGDWRQAFLEAVQPEIKMEELTRLFELPHRLARALPPGRDPGAVADLRAWVDARRGPGRVHSLATRAARRLTSVLAPLALALGTLAPEAGAQPAAAPPNAPARPPATPASNPPVEALPSVTGRAHDNKVIVNRLTYAIERHQQARGLLLKAQSLHDVQKARSLVHDAYTQVKRAGRGLLRQKETLEGQRRGLPIYDTLLARIDQAGRETRAAMRDMGKIKAVEPGQIRPAVARLDHVIPIVSETLTLLPF